MPSRFLIELGYNPYGITSQSSTINQNSTFSRNNIASQSAVTRRNFDPFNDDIEYDDVDPFQDDSNVFFE